MTASIRDHLTPAQRDAWDRIWRKLLLDAPAEVRDPKDSQPHEDNEEPADVAA